jgi:Domain of unknown function (DUF4145)
MKCPHCNTGISQAFATVAFPAFPLVTSREGTFLAAPVTWSASYQRCSECHEVIIYLNRVYSGYTTQKRGTNVGHHAPYPPYSFLAHPNARTRSVAPEVVDPYRQDFQEACKVLADSPKASAALSRRCLQAILRDKAGTATKDLYEQIEEVTNPPRFQAHIVEGLHAVRNIGNIAAHSMKSTTTGAIVDVEPGEAEWNLDVLEMPFDFYFVQPAIAAKRKAELNAKLREIGKPEIP